MEYKYINLFLLFIIVILIAMNYNLAKYQENFISNRDVINANIRAAQEAQNNKNKNNKSKDAVLKTNLEEGSNYVQDSETLQDMFRAVSNSEALCDELENNQKNRDMIEQYKINESTLRELTDQKKRINELKKVVNYLRKEKLKRQTVSDKCRVETQKKLNKDYKLVQKLSEKGLLKDNSHKIKLKVSDDLKRLKNRKTARNNANVSVANVNNTNSTTTSTKPPRFATKRCPYINPSKFIHKDKVDGKCLNCNVNNIAENYEYLMKDFA